jgi:hypothetical protein
MKVWWKKDCLISVFLILILAGIGYGHLWRQGEVVYSPHSDFVAHYLGVKTVFFDSIREGRGIPFWRDDLLAGLPAFTNPQSLYTYPLHILFYFLEPIKALGGTYWLHVIASAWVFYLVGAALGLAKWSRIFMAVSAMFSYKLVLAIYTGWTAVIPAMVCFPLLFVAVFYIENKNGLKTILALACASAICIHTGHLQLIYYSFWFVAAYVLVKTIQWCITRQWQTVRKVACRLFFGGALGVGISAYLLVPLAGEATLLSRSHASYDTIVANHVVTFRHLLTFFHPEAAGNPLQPTQWENIAYFGLLPFILSMAGAILGWRRFHTRFLVASFFFSVIAAMDTPLLKLFYNAVPGFNLFRCPSRFLFLTAFFGITLASIGLDEVIRRAGQLWENRFFAPVLSIILVIVVSYEGISYSRQYITTAPMREVFPQTAYEAFFASDKTIYRIATLYGPTINYGWAARIGLQMISGYEPFNLSHYQDYFDLLRHGAVGSKDARHFMDLTRISRADLLDALNVKYLVTPGPLGGPSGRFHLLKHWKDQPIFVFFSGMTRGDIYVYLNKHFLSRAYWAKEVMTVEDERQMIALMKEKEIGDTAIILKVKQKSDSAENSTRGKVEVLEASSGSLLLRTENEGRGFLTVSEVWHPGWKAFVDGQELRLHRSNLALMGAWIPPGEHTIDLRFRPVNWRISVVITAVSSIVFIFLLFVVLWKRRQ